MMKFSTRAGVLLFAFGATAASAQSVASAAELTPAQVTSTEDAASQAMVPVNAQVGDALRDAQAPLPGPSISGAIPAVPVMPPSAAQFRSQFRPGSVVPDPVVPPLNVTRRMPTLGVSAPVPGYGRLAEPGRVGLDAPSGPLHTAGPALGIGDPLKFSPKAPGSTRPGWVHPQELRPELITPAVSAVPGATATFAQDNNPVSLTRALGNGITATKGVAEDLPDAL